MCGVAGSFNTNGSQVNQGLLERMAGILRHRGPDSSGVLVRGAIGLAHARLAIIDTSAAGAQPMQDATERYAITFNGEIYNFTALRQELEALGNEFHSHTDTEVVLLAYRQWGKACLKKLNGMFSFAIADFQEKTVFLARDPMGEKPLYYCQQDGKFSFASEIKAILQDETVSRRIGQQGLANYLVFGHSVAPDTMLEDVKKLLPGHCMVVSAQATAIEPYWEIPTPNGQADKGEQAYVRELEALLEQSVKERLMSDVPLGIFLSGGIDSSLIAYYAKKHTKGPLKTFSVGFVGEGGEFNELPDAKIVADALGTEHHALVFPESDLPQLLEKIVWHFDEPFADAAALPLSMMAEFAKREVSVVLTGEGADELFGGYRRYAAENNAVWFSALNSVFALGVFPLSRRMKKMVRAFAHHDWLERYVSWISYIDPEQVAQVSSQASADPLRMYKAYLSRYNGISGAQRGLLIDQRGLLPDGYLEKADKATMAFGLETRPPFLSSALVAFANALPLHYKTKGLQTKVLLRKLAAKVLPASVAAKPKHGFAVPTQRWLKGPLNAYAKEVLLGQRARDRGILNAQYIERLFTKLDEGQAVTDQLWLLLCFELWCRQYLDT